VRPNEPVSTKPLSDRDQIFSDNPAGRAADEETASDGSLSSALAPVWANNGRGCKCRQPQYATPASTAATARAELQKIKIRTRSILGFRALETWPIAGLRGAAVEVSSSEF
jgi:hypothetical protein